MRGLPRRRKRPKGARMKRVPQFRGSAERWADVWERGPYALAEMSDDEIQQFIRDSRAVMVLAIKHARDRRGLAEPREPAREWNSVARRWIAAPTEKL